MEPEEHKSPIVPIVLSVLVSALVFGGLGYYFGQSMASNNTTQTTTYSSPTATATVATIATTTPTPTSSAATTKAFENKDHGYSFKYPSDWVDVTTSYKGTDLTLFTPKTDYYAKQPGTTEVLPDVQMSYYATVKDLTKNETTLADYLKNQKGTPNVVSYSSKKVGGVDGYEVEVGGLGDYKAYYVEKNGHLYTLEFPSSNFTAAIGTDQAAILASFTFTK
jgi:hypothetical protein